MKIEYDEDEFAEEKKDPVSFYNTFGKAMERLCIHCVNSKETNEHEKAVAIHLLYSVSRYLFINMNQAIDSTNFGNGEHAEELYQQAIRQMETMEELAHVNDEEKKDA